MPSRSVSAALHALIPPPEADESDYLPAFRAIADLVLNQSTWQIGQVPHRIVEIEVYWNGAGHLDTFTHGDPMQREFGRWYFHRQGGEYRGGTYKGLDIAFGRADVVAGILIRGAERLADGALLDGPCTCVDHLLEQTGQPSIRALVDRFDRSIDPPDDGDSPLYLELAGDRGAAICESPRVGLTLKRGDLGERARFLARPYRFLSEPARIKKGRLHAVIGLARQGLAPPEIAARTGSTAAQVNKYLAQYEAGRRREPREFVKDLGADETCQLLGACDEFAARS
jgi:hypothetical protein